MTPRGTCRHVHHSEPMLPARRPATRRAGGGASSSCERRFFASRRRSREAASASSGRAAAPRGAPPAAARRAARPRARGSGTGSARPARPPAAFCPPSRPRAASGVSVSAEDASTSKTASTRVSAVFACCPPGPLEREKRSSTSASGSTTERVTRIDSSCMAAILLDVDGVLHVSGEPIPGAVEAVARLRTVGHRLRFVTNNSSRSRAALAEELRAMGFVLDDDELQTTPVAAAQRLGGRRVYALVMSAIVPDLAEIDLVGEGADAVLLGGCDETTETEPGLQPHEPRPRVLRDPGRRGPLLPAQEPLVADRARPHARRRRVRGRARVRDRGGGDGARQAERRRASRPPSPSSMPSRS